MDQFNLKIWRCHPHGVRIIKAEKTLNNTANAAANKWCGPYNYANMAGWWIFPPSDIDILWHGENRFTHKELSPYQNEEVPLVQSLIRPSDQCDTEKWCPSHQGRSKFTWGAVEPGVIQIWTGCVFQTPPGWCLHIRSPINTVPQPYHVMEGVLETDWMQYDIWINLVVDKKDELIQLRRDQWPPLAQIVPIRREVYDEEWETYDQVMHRESEEANKVFEYWCQYNMKKFGSGGKQALTPDMALTKDSTTYFRERKKYLNPKKIEKLTKKKINRRLVKQKPRPNDRGFC